ncbi:MAG: hypothetical protein PHC68_02585 [Syntrophorhabdaceae bacterium]|nr:hypothetical protein [Syntrophorhabdaceae bacterium]
MKNKENMGKAFAVRCPLCGAEPWDRCTYPCGREIVEPESHSVRYKKAVRKVKESK